jgi:hypothetical protein
MIDTLDTYRQMVSMGPRRSGRSVANVMAAGVVARRHGRATIVAANAAHAQQLRRDAIEFGVRGVHPVEVVTLAGVRSAGGPFFPDHYTIDTVIQRYSHEIKRLRKEVERRNAYIMDLTGEFDHETG